MKSLRDTYEVTASLQNNDISSVEWRDVPAVLGSVGKDQEALHQYLTDKVASAMPGTHVQSIDVLPGLEGNFIAEFTYARTPGASMTPDNDFAYELGQLFDYENAVTPLQPGECTDPTAKFLIYGRPSQLLGDAMRNDAAFGQKIQAGIMAPRQPN